MTWDLAVDHEDLTGRGHEDAAASSRTAECDEHAAAVCPGPDPCECSGSLSDNDGHAFAGDAS
eukprot:10108123-Prorocentrum_lima.AAC.1